MLRKIKQISEIDHSLIDVKVGLPERNWLNIWGHTEMLAFPLIEIEMHPAVVDIESSSTIISIYESAGYTKEYEELLRIRYSRQNLSLEEIKFRLRENRLKKEITKRIADAILDYWQIIDFEKKDYDNDKVKTKRLSWGFVDKYNIDED